MNVFVASGGIVLDISTCYSVSTRYVSFSFDMLKFCSIIAICTFFLLHLQND